MTQGQGVHGQEVAPGDKGVTGNGLIARGSPNEDYENMVQNYFQPLFRCSATILKLKIVAERLKVAENCS